MRLADKLLLRLAKKELSRNRQFKDLHKGETCYLFGNGVSLKSMDLRKFSDRISIACNTLLVHRHFGELDCRYYQIPAPFFFYPFRRYYEVLQRNYIAAVYRKKMPQCTRTRFFTSLSNWFGMQGEHIYYTHHFGSRAWNLDESDMAGVFSLMSGGMQAMLGTALYMGFRSAVLVGCDYTFSPSRSRHFFEKGRGVLGQESADEDSRRFFAEAGKRIDLCTIVQEGMKSDLLEYRTYEQYTGTPERFAENTELVDGSSLELLNRQNAYTIY